ncbi:thioredoxin family protein [Methanoplanus limicola]|uniref:Thioredoxin domain-containing protein n=1 Tax=Methanoplanus limicola DSM 2279 TaxID=937775 RepID=H1YY80_9EURY|nr:thioredoxin family protein [Methanoplanus limicola]EHQ34175.1 Thioredoxin domain-containing protein [Methanoplanus limicola DSM 2279]
MTGERIQELDDKNWEKMVENSKKPAIVMFYSETCSHCRTMKPYFEKFAGEYGDRIIFGMLDVVESPWIRERYAIMSTPTFKYFCGGKPVSDLIGAVYPKVLENMIKDMLNHGKECAEKSSDIDYEITGYA